MEDADVYGKSVARITYANAPPINLYQGAGNTIVQLLRFSVFVFMHEHERIKSLCAGEKFSGAQYGSNRCYRSARPSGNYELIAPKLEARCGIQPSDLNTKPCGRRRVLSPRICRPKIRWCSLVLKPAP